MALIRDLSAKYPRRCTGFASVLPDAGHACVTVHGRPWIWVYRLFGLL